MENTKIGIFPIKNVTQFTPRIAGGAIVRPWTLLFTNKKPN